MKSPAIKLTPSPPATEMHDHVQALLQRKAELARNKAKYTLTERDGSLLVTHALEVQFMDGQTIVEAGHSITNVYRVKSGQVDIFKNGNKCCQLTQGFFIGEALLLYDDKSTYKMNVTLKANGPVTLLQLDLSFIKTLFSLDISLSMKFYHLLATKSASIFHQLVVTLNTPALLSSSLELDSSTSSDTASDTSEMLQSSQSSQSLSQSQSQLQPQLQPRVTLPRSQSYTSLLKRTSKRIMRSTNDAYKVYPLVSKHGVQTIRVKPKKLKIVTRSFGFVHKVSITFATLNSITKIGENGATILHGGKAHTIFFKNFHDLGEFMYLVASLTTPNEQTPIVANEPVSSPTAEEEDEEKVDPQVTQGEEHFRSVQSELELKKGDKLFEEGDLFQRVYTLVSGTLNVYQNGVFLHALTEGQVFGVDTILFLRPAPVTIEVASDTAELLVLPAYKMHELIDSDIAVAQHLFKRAAQILEAQIAKILQVEQQLQGDLSRRSMELLRSKSSQDVSRKSHEIERSISLTNDAWRRSQDLERSKTMSQDLWRRSHELQRSSSQEVSRMSQELDRPASQEIGRMPVDDTPPPLPPRTQFHRSLKPLPPRPPTEKTPEIAITPALAISGAGST